MVFFVYENYEAAIETFNKAIELNPKYAEAYTRRGMAKYQSKKYGLTGACEDFKMGDELKDPLATEYINEYCK